MRVFEAGDYIILRGDKIAEKKFREPLSTLIIEKFGRGPFNQQNVSNILFFCRDYYITEFEKISQNEKSYTFYKEVFWLNEQASALRFKEEYNSLPEGIDKAYISGYRRVLKLILEQVCLIDMFSGEKKDEAFKKRIHEVLNDLLFLGEMIFHCGESIAEQAMIEDAHDVIFDENDLYRFKRRHHYEFVFEHISNEMEKHNPKYIMDDKGGDDYEEAIKTCFGIEYQEIKHIIGLIMEKFNLKPGDVISAHSESFIKDIAISTQKDEIVVQNFLAGLILDSNNKLPVSEVTKKPNSLNRFLYRPLLKWKINNKSYYVFGNYSWFEAENSLFLNAIPWGKIPAEWQNNSCFTKYVNRKEDEHDKWLDDKVEQVIVSAGLLYQRGVKKIIAKDKVHSLIIKDLGEIDFLILNPAIKKVFVVECKHLVGRYDMVNWKNDFDNFTAGESKSFNKRLGNKVQWLQDNRKSLEEHLQAKFKQSDLSIEEYSIEGIFFINTPTFYMYNSQFRIYTYDQIHDVITGQHQDPSFTFLVDNADSTITYSIKYPFFQKPKILYYEAPDDDEEVDKYGYPIKKNSSLELHNTMISEEITMLTEMLQSQKNYSSY